MAINNSQRLGFGVELSGTVTTSGFTQIGSTGLLYNPVIIIFDNQGMNSVLVSVDGVNTWRTFPAGEALILDLRANHGIAPNFTIDAGMKFYGQASSSTSVFSISYVYAIPM